MKSLLKISVLLVLAIVPMSAFAQGSTETTKKGGDRWGDKWGLASCVSPSSSGGSMVAKEGELTTQNWPKPKLKSLKADSTGTIIQSGCETVLAGPVDSVTFRWMTNMPKPPRPNYRLKVWQLMKGQDPASAMRSNQPIVVKEIADVEYLTLNNVIQGPCKLPYMCDWVWEVQALSADGKPTGNPQVGSVDGIKTNWSQGK